MKSGIHPDKYRLGVFKDMSNDYQFMTKSTANSKDKIEIDGVKYPLIKLEISNTSHPFYHHLWNNIHQDIYTRFS